MSEQCEGLRRAKACLENIDELGKNSDDGNKRSELHAN
jgi:hypothetical protein